MNFNALGKMTLQAKVSANEKNLVFFPCLHSVLPALWLDYPIVPTLGTYKASTHSYGPLLASQSASIILVALTGLHLFVVL